MPDLRFLRLAAQRCLPVAAAALAGLMALGLPAAPARADAGKDLAAALAEAGPGAEIRLPAGNYGALRLKDRKFPKGVTLTSADPGKPAVFSRVELKGVENLTFDGLVFDYTFSGNRVFDSNTMLDYLVNVNGSSNVTIRNSVFDGDTASGTGTAADGYGAGTAIGVGGSTNITIENNEISNFQRGLAPAYSTNMVIRGNNIHSLRTDGMNVIQMNGITIEGNYIHDFIRSPKSGDHSDMIQFWTNGTKKPSTGVVIRDNVLDVRAGDFTQTIFMGNEAVGAGAGEEMYYKNIRITGNVIVNGHTNAIRVGAADGVVVANNTLIRVARAASKADLQNPVRIPRINVAGESRNVTIRNNLAADWPKADKAKGGKGWTVEGNFVIQDITPSRAGYYHKVFANAQLGDPRDMESYVYLPGTAGAEGRAGAALLRPGVDRSRYGEK